MLPLITAGASILGKLLGGAAKGQSDERTKQNQFTLDRNGQALSQYGTQQGALLNSLIAGGNEATNRYGTNQNAITNAMQGQQTATSHAMDAQSAENLNRAQLGLQAPSVRAKQSVLGSLMKNLQPVSIQGPAGQAGHESKITGGLSAAALDPMTRQHGDELMKAALQAQLSGSDIPEKTNFASGIQNWGSTVLTPPAATDYSKGLLAPPKLDGYKSAGTGESLLSGASMGGNILSEILKLMAQGKGSEQPSDSAGWG